MHGTLKQQIERLLRVLPPGGLYDRSGSRSACSNRPYGKGLWTAALICAPLLAAAQTSSEQTSLAQFGTAQEAAHFARFAYADAAPRRDGSLTLSHYGEVTSYDSLNPFLLRGSPAPDIRNLMFDTLMQRSWDELASEYPLIAKRVSVAPDGMSASFDIDPDARFSNGDPILADDVKYSFDTLSGPHVSPLISGRYSLIRHAVVLDKRRIRFDFWKPDRSAPLIAGDLYVFSRKWGARSDNTLPPFDQISNVPPIASGPYTILRRDGPRDITYGRNPRYWAANLPSRAGMFNFATVRFKLYQDPYTSLQAFKSGDVDVSLEGSASQWARNYSGRHFSDGTLIKQEFPQHNMSGMQALFFNLRREKFRDIRVRQAIGLALDYDWINRNMFFGQYERTRSYFDDSVFAASGLPSADELALLKPIADRIPAAAFGQMPLALPSPKLRDNFRRALQLLAQAGWVYRDGFIRNAEGQPLSIELLDDGTGMERILMIVIRNLRMIGIDAHIRIMDQAIINERLKRFDYDMTTLSFPDVSIPGIELQRQLGRAEAMTPGSENYSGVQSPEVDTLIAAVTHAATETQLIAATRALDRVLMSRYYVVPEWHVTHARIAYNRRIEPPVAVPHSYSWVDWLIDYWSAAAPRASSASAH